MSQSRTLTQISTGRMKAAILRHARSKNPAFFWGHPGVAKSAVIAQTAAGLGYHLEDIRLSQISSIDLRGLPTKAGTEDAPSVVWAMPDFLKRAKQKWDEEGIPTIFLFDELNSAGSEVMKAAYQFIFDRKIGPFELGPKDFVLAAGNFSTDGAGVSEMPVPLLNRFTHYHVTVNAKDWCEWAIRTNKLPWVIAFIDANPNRLHAFSEGAADAVKRIQSDNDKAFHTPRTWEFLSNDLHAMQNTEFSTYEDVSVSKEQEESGFTIEPFNEDDLDILASTTIGSGVGQDFVTFVKKGKDLPRAQDVIDGKAEESETLRKNISGMYMLANSVCYILKNEKDTMNGLPDAERKVFKSLHETHIKNFINFAHKNFSPDMFTSATVEKMTRQLRIIAPMGSDESKLVLDAFKKITQIDRAEI